MSKGNKTLLTLLVLCMLAVSVQGGLIEDFTKYVYRWFIWGNFMGSTIGCWAFGIWGLFFDDDNGLLINTCMKIYGGSTVKFENVNLKLN